MRQFQSSQGDPSKCPRPDADRSCNRASLPGKSVQSVHPGENSLQRKFMAPNGMASEMNKLVSIAALLAVPLSALTTVGPDYDATDAGALKVPASYSAVEATPGSPSESARRGPPLTDTT